MTRTGEYSPYRLFSMMKTTGADHTEAMLSASWNVPMFVVPSPKNVSATRSSPWSLAESAAPTATGSPAPTIAKAPIRPREKSVKCIEPPTPPQQPVERPIISAKRVSSSSPRAIACPCPRYVTVR